MLATKLEHDGERRADLAGPLGILGGWQLCCNPGGQPLRPALASGSLGSRSSPGAVLGFVMAAVTGSLRGHFLRNRDPGACRGIAGRRVHDQRPDRWRGGPVPAPSTAADPVDARRASRRAAAIAAVMAAWLLVRSRYHYAFRAMRSNESACQMLGVDPPPVPYRHRRPVRRGRVMRGGPQRVVWRLPRPGHGVHADLYHPGADCPPFSGASNSWQGRWWARSSLSGWRTQRVSCWVTCPVRANSLMASSWVLAVLFMSGGLCGAVVKRLRTKPATARTHPAEALP